MAWFDSDYVIRLIQQSQDMKSLLTHIHCRHRREEEEEELRGQYGARLCYIPVQDLLILCIRYSCMRSSYF